MAFYFSNIRYNLTYSERTGFVGLSNYEFFETAPAFEQALLHILLLVGSVLAISVIFGFDGGDSH